MLTLALLQGVLRALGLEAFVVLNDAHECVGIFTFIQRATAIEIGLAMRPDLTGRGLGLAFVEAGLDFARARYAPGASRSMSPPSTSVPGVSMSAPDFAPSKHSRAASRGAHASSLPCTAPHKPAAP